MCELVQRACAWRRPRPGRRPSRRRGRAAARRRWPRASVTRDQLRASRLHESMAALCRSTPCVLSRSLRQRLDPYHLRSLDTSAIGLDGSATRCASPLRRLVGDEDDGLRHDRLRDAGRAPRGRPLHDRSRARSPARPCARRSPRRRPAGRAPRGARSSRPHAPAWRPLVGLEACRRAAERPARAAARRCRRCRRPPRRRWRCRRRPARTSITAADEVALDGDGVGDARRPRRWRDASAPWSGARAARCRSRSAAPRRAA